MGEMNQERETMWCSTLRWSWTSLLLSFWHTEACWLP
jgi:hypothetical protein